MAENLHPVANPAVDADGNVYATVSGARGQQVPVSIFQIQRDFQIRPFVRELLNPTGLAFAPDGYLYASSRAEELPIYRTSPHAGAVSTYAEGMGIATGIAFDHDGNLFVGDRTGTIFKIAPPTASGSSGEIFVHATLEPSIAAYHLAFNATGTLFVTGPTTSSNQAIYAIDPDGTASVNRTRASAEHWGMAIRHRRQSIRRRQPPLPPPHLPRLRTMKQASLAVSGSNLARPRLPRRRLRRLATRDALYHVDLGTSLDGSLI